MEGSYFFYTNLNSHINFLYINTYYKRSANWKVIGYDPTRNADYWNYFRFLNLVMSNASLPALPQFFSVGSY